MKVLVVEDELEIQSLISMLLQREGFEIITASSVHEAYDKLRASHVDLVTLDWMLPGISGIEFIDYLKKNHSEAKIMMITAKTEPEDIIQGLDRGADDYLTKPFEPNVFLARVRALVRRISSQKTKQSEILKYNDLTIDLEKYECRLKGKVLDLTPSEYKLLVCLVQNEGTVQTRDKLIQSIQGEGVNVTGRTVDTHIFGLRKKLEVLGENVDTIRGIGYRLKGSEN